MSPDLIIGILVGLLVAVAALAGYLARSKADAVAVWRAVAEAAEDRAHASEIRSAQQLDAMLDRVVTSERLELQPAVPATPELSPEPAYVSDLPYMDETWNDMREPKATD